MHREFGAQARDDGCGEHDDEGDGAFASYRISAQSLRRFYSGRARTVRRDSTARPLLAVGAGRMALQIGGTVVLLKPSGARVARVDAADVESVALARTELGIAGRTSLGVYDPATGHLRKAIALGPSGSRSGCRRDRRTKISAA